MFFGSVDRVSEILERRKRETEKYIWDWQKTWDAASVDTLERDDLFNAREHEVEPTKSENLGKP